jgi:hypothetical protein
VTGTNICPTCTPPTHIDITVLTVVMAEAPPAGMFPRPSWHHPHRYHHRRRWNALRHFALAWMALKEAAAEGLT